MKRKGLKQIAPGEVFRGFCVVRKVELKQKQNGEAFLSLELGDFSGRIPAVYWEHAEELYSSLAVGTIIKVQGRVHLYQEHKQMRIEKLRLARDGEVPPESLLPRSNKSVGSLYKRFLVHYHSIQNPHLNQLLRKIFPDEKILQHYLKLPSGKLWHHNYLYGILEHLLCLLDGAEMLVNHYPELQLDLLKTGIILHAIGTEQTLQIKGFIDYSDEGRLVGRATLSALVVETKIREIENFPESLRTELLHLIISQAQRDISDASVQPMSREAIALQKLNELDVMLNAVERIIRNDRLPHSAWTRYNNLLDRFVYVGDESNHQRNGEQNDEV